MKQSVQVTILGQQYTVRSDADPCEVRAVADFVNQRINEVQNAAQTANSYTAVVLALFNVAGELVRERSQSRGRQEGEERLTALLSRLEAACLEPGPEAASR